MIEEALTAAAQAGVETVTILGGEPTIDLRFFDVLRRAKELGFRRITIFTNGVRGEQRVFLENVAAIGRFHWRVSIQGGDAASHDAVVGRVGAFAKIVALLGHLQATGQVASVNLCVTEQSHRSLVELPSLLARFGVGELHIDLIRPSSAGQRSTEHLLAILPRFDALAQSVATMLARFDADAPSVDVHVGNLPYCLLPGETRRIFHGGDETVTWTTGRGGGPERVGDKYAAQKREMVHGPPCDGCAARVRCRGVPSVYAETYGWSEFRPLAMAIAPPPRSGERRTTHPLFVAAARLSAQWTPPDPYGRARVEARGDGLRLSFPLGTAEVPLWLRRDGDGVVVTIEGGVSEALGAPLMSAVRARLGLGGAP